MEVLDEFSLPIIYGGAGLAGLACCFFGFRIFRLMVVLLLGATGALTLAWFGLEYGSDPIIWSVAGLLLGAVLGLVLAMLFYTVAVSTLGALLAATLLLPWLQAYSLPTQWAVLGVACLVAALAANIVANFTIRVATAMLGAVLVVHSVAYFTQGTTVFHQAEAEGDWRVMLNLDTRMAAVALVLGVLGLLVQLRGTPRD